MADKYSKLIEERYDEWKETIEHCGLFLLKESDDEIMYHIFEEFDIGVRVYCNEEMLELFFDNGLINENMMIESIELMKLFCEMQTNYFHLWNVESIRKHPRWKKIMELADSIKSKIYI